LPLNGFLQTRDKVTLHSFFIRHPEKKGNAVPTLVYFHGNAGNIGGRLQNCNGIYHQLQCNILLVGLYHRYFLLHSDIFTYESSSFIVEYRGYGLSSGTPSEKGIYIDARAAVDYLFTRHDVDHAQIALFGRSLGGAVVRFTTLLVSEVFT
jgi:abhydrolase domain-containing protein 13